MKTIPFICTVLFIVATCISYGQPKYEQKDKEILENIFENLGNDKAKTTADLCVLVGNTFKGTPYVAHTLELEPEQLVINLRELDCTTYAENCLAIARTIKSGNLTFEEFGNQLRTIRYREGKVDGYLSRLHYFSDWIYENEKKGLVKSESKEIANIPYDLNVDFMSKHPDSYKQLKSNDEHVSKLSEKEQEISRRTMFFIPKEKLPKFESKLQEGDIVGLTTSVKGLDITHVGIIVKQKKRVHLMHASSKAEEVIVSEETLHEYLMERKSVTGVMVARPIEERNN